MAMHEIKVGIQVSILGPCEVRYEDEDETITLPSGDKIDGNVFEYSGDGRFKVATEGGHYVEAHRDVMVPDTPEYRLGTLVFGKSGTIDTPNPPHFVKPPEGRGGRCSTPVESALFVLTLSPHTRAVLHIVDPQGLKQADAALKRTGWIGGEPWPDDTLSTQERALKSIGTRLLEVGKHLSKWQGISDTPQSHPDFAALIEAGIPPYSVKEFARIAAERCGENRLALLNVGRNLGFSTTELFQAEEVAADEA